MPAIEDDDRPKKKITHEIGQDLTLLSVREKLTERIALLKDEIARLEADITRKQALALGRRSALRQRQVASTGRGRSAVATRRRVVASW